MNQNQFGQTTTRNLPECDMQLRHFPGDKLGGRGL